MANSLSRKKDPRRSLMRNLSTSLILYEEIRTTKAKAKEVKPIVEKLISNSKKNNLASHRMLLSYLFDKKAVKKMNEVIVPRYKKMQSGFVLSYKLGNRLGDSAQIVILKLHPGEVAPIKEEVKNAPSRRKEPEKNVERSKESPKSSTKKAGARTKKANN